MGLIDVLVNNAGMAFQGEAQLFSDLAHMSVEVWNTSIARNLMTAFLLIPAVLPGMQGHRSPERHALTRSHKKHFSHAPQGALCV